MRPCSLENFLNKVDESLRSCSPLCFFLSFFLLVTKTKPVLVFFCFLFFEQIFFYYYEYEYDFCFIFVDRVCIYYMSISLYTDFYSHFASPDTFICLFFVLFLSFSFCYSSDYVITIYAEICENVDSRNKQQTGRPKPYKQTPETC